ncbi:hypothetical protein niasHT_029740 [Heterodera trifolii]|uniref:G_PROTEIN_RECEP_F1_2 domain-containing protein n=1 Tax=Heterodera trifolii TaxID=157864 RepID=A0ABD2KQZ3_9BILA
MNDSFEIFLAFNDQRPCWPLIGSAILLSLVAFFGIISNFTLIYVTIRTKSLRGTANFLLALTCFFEILHQHGHFLFLYVAISGRNFIEFHLALKICIVSLFGMAGIAPSLTFTAIDRLICIVFPKIQINRKGLYLSFYSFVCILVGIFQTKVAFDTANQIGSQPITGTIGDLLTAHLGKTFNVPAMMFNCATIFIYVFIGIVIQKHKAKISPSNAESTNCRIFRSIAIIICVNIGGYFTLNIFRSFIGPQIASPIVKWFTRQILAILSNISSASIGPILYMTSEDYRRAICKEFAWLKKLIGNEETPEIQNNPPNNNGLNN